MCTLTFRKDVLSGRKSLLKVTQIAGVPDVPRIPQINAETIWNDIKHENTIIQYFPEIYVNSARIPDRTYMFVVGLEGICRSSAKYLQTHAYSHRKLQRTTN